MVIGSHAPDPMGLRLLGHGSVHGRVIGGGVGNPGIGEIAGCVVALHDAHRVTELEHGVADRGRDHRDDSPGLDERACTSRGHSAGADDDHGLARDIEGERVAAHLWSPHSFLP